MEDTAIALKVLVAAAKAQPENASVYWTAARHLLHLPLNSQKLASLIPGENAKKISEPPETRTEMNLPALKAEFDYLDENGLYTHRTIYVMEVTDGRDIKRNHSLPVADRYGYLLTGYCTLRKQIRSFRSSRISNLRTFMEGEPRQANRQWRPQSQKLAS